MKTSIIKTTILKTLGLAIGICLAQQTMQAQNIGINSAGASPNNSSILDLNTGNTFTSPNGKGMLPPNVALTGISDVVTVTSPATSLWVYNTATANTGTNAVAPGFYYWDGAKWVAGNGNDWTINGNGNTTAATNFLGTTNVQDLVIKTNNTEKMRVTSGGNVGIGTSSPTSSLSIVATTTNTGFQLKDGTQGIGKTLVSDANGNASWDNPSLPYSTITIPSTSISIIAGSPVLFYTLTFPSYGLYNVNIAFCIKDYPFAPATNFVVQMLPVNNSANWNSLSTRFLGSYEVFSSYVSDGTNRVYYNENIKVTPSTGLVGYFFLYNNTSVNCSIRADNTDPSLPQVSGGSWTKLSD